jgi:RNA polymerase sigma-70 factor (ECF subfamily)
MRLNPDTDHLLDRAAAGDGAARQRLLERHRPRLRRMVALRLDQRLRARVDPSDVVQEALFDADQELSDYLKRRPIPFYPWLRQLAWDRLIDLNRRHIRAKKRTVDREEAWEAALPNESTLELVDRLIDLRSSASRKLLREELRTRVSDALRELSARNREILVLRHLEQLSTSETAAILHITEGAVKLRHLRALDRLRSMLEAEFGEDLP